jgi:hypothetical protein
LALVLAEITGWAAADFFLDATAGFDFAAAGLDFGLDLT